MFVETVDLYSSNFIDEVHSQCWFMRFINLVGFVFAIKSQKKTWSRYTVFLLWWCKTLQVKTAALMLLDTVLVLYPSKKILPQVGSKRFSKTFISSGFLFSLSKWTIAPFEINCSKVSFSSSSGYFSYILIFWILPLICFWFLTQCEAFHHW